jgi:hypothetical protein
MVTIKIPYRVNFGETLRVRSFVSGKVVGWLRIQGLSPVVVTRLV